MATQAQIEASRANGKKSKGPKTPEGRLASSLNATKHGRRSIKASFMRGDSLTFEERRCKWLGAEDPQTDMGEYLVAQVAAISCEFDRCLQAHIQRLNTAIDNLEDTEGEKAFDMLDQLFGDPAGHRCLFGILPHNRTKLEKTSGDGVDPDQLNPRKLVAAMEASEMGCTALYSTWQDLKSQLDGTSGTFWQPLDRLKAIRLIGCNPIQANENLQVAEIFVASHALHPAGREHAFDDIRSDMTDTQHDYFCKGIWARWPDELKIARKPANAREILIDLCDEHIEKLANKLVEHAENQEKHIREAVTSLKLDHTPEGKDARAYLMKCDSAVKRSVEALRKYKVEQRKAQGGRGYEEPRKIQEPSLTRKRRDGSAEEANLLNPDIAWALGPYPGGDAPTAKQRNEARWAEAANSFPLPLLVGEGRGEGLPAAPANAQPEASDQRHDAGAAGAGQSPRDQSAAVEPAEALIRQGENCRNAANEPELDENVIITRTEDGTGVMANSDADSGLDKGVTSSMLNGSSPAGVEDRDNSGAEELEGSDHAPGMGIVNEPADPQLPTAVARIASEPAESLIRQTELSQNTTNEPENREPANIEKTQKTADFLPVPSASAGLDKAGPSPVVSGPSPVDTRRHGSLAQRAPEGAGAGVKQEGRTVKLVAAGSKTNSQVSTRKAEAHPWRDRPAGGGRRAQDRKRERERQREWATKSKELKRTLDEKINPVTVLKRDLIMDPNAPDAKTEGIVGPPFPRSP